MEEVAGVECPKGTSSLRSGARTASRAISSHKPSTEMLPSPLKGSDRIRAGHPKEISCGADSIWRKETTTWVAGVECPKGTSSLRSGARTASRAASSHQPSSKIHTAPPKGGAVCIGAGGGGRTRTSSRTQDFESSASANSTTPAFARILYNTSVRNASKKSGTAAAIPEKNLKIRASPQRRGPDRRNTDCPARRRPRLSPPARRPTLRLPQSYRRASRERPSPA